MDGAWKTGTSTNPHRSQNIQAKKAEIPVISGIINKHGITL